MTREEILGLILTLIGSGIYIYNMDKICNLYNRTIFLNSISHDYFIDSDKIKIAREKKVDNRFNLDNLDIYLQEHVNLFDKSYSKEELMLLKYNLETLKINYIRKKISNFGGSYNPDTNTVTMDGTYETINHEIHHIATNLGTVDDVTLVGFTQFYKKKSIGNGFNEAYTEYLSKNMSSNDNYGYKRVVDIIPLIEVSYDNKNILRKNYFDADLPAVIRKFQEVFTKEESINIIRDIDKLWGYSTFNTWFNKEELLDLSIRLRLYDYYRKLSGSNDKKEMFFNDDMMKKLVFTN